MTLLDATTPTKVDLGVMVMKENSEFPKALALLKPHHQNV